MAKGKIHVLIKFEKEFMRKAEGYGIDVKKEREGVMRSEFSFSPSKKPDFKRNDAITELLLIDCLKDVYEEEIIRRKLS